MIIEITNGQNIINFYGISLIIKNVVKAFNWNDNEGSIGQYYTVSETDKIIS